MIKIVGDINYTDGFFDTGFGIGSKIRKGMDPFKNIVFNINDIFIGNLECVCSSYSNKQGIYKKQFIIDPDYLKHIHHFNIYSVANNHSMQHGEEAFLDTIRNINSFKSLIFGSLKQKSIRFKYNSNSIGMMSFSYRHENFSTSPKYWHLPDLSDIGYEFTKIADCDLKVAYIHWGNEFINRPYFDQKIIAHNLIDSGFDLVVGLHAHVLQGYEIYRGKYIFYSLGNFLFNMPTEDTHYSIILKVDLDTSKNLLIDFSYVRLDKFGFPKIIDTSEIPERFQFNYLNEILSNNCDNEEYYKQLFDNIKSYRYRNIFSIVKSIPKYSLNVLSGMLWDFIKRRLK
jgi:capsule synthesis protein PGA_cap